MPRNELFSLIPPGAICIELGVAEGIFSEQLLIHTKLALLYSIDRYLDRGHNISQYYKTAMKLRSYGNRSIFLRTEFEEIVYLFPDRFFDFIYIDGYAHTGQEEGKTLSDWYPKLKFGGIFAGDDYDVVWPKTIAAVEKFRLEQGKREGKKNHLLQLHEIKGGDGTSEKEHKYGGWWIKK